ncbi:MAG: YHS domain-containing protein [Bryobacteraceae bacterium]|nr:YHS domain-containing protein [Bryobacteraceae bacterium]
MQTLSLLAATLAVGHIQAKDPVEAVNKDGKGLALKGYDPVAYFTQSKPVPGDPKITVDWSGAKWQFSSEQNRDQFKADPEKFAPQFGGYCAWAVSEGYTADADPQAWKVVDGKLYVNYNKGVQKKWEADQPQRVEKAAKNWPGLHK